MIWIWPFLEFVVNKDILIITGCEGFIGSNVARYLLKNYSSISIIGCGSLNKKEKLMNINDLNLIDYWDKSELFENLSSIDKNRIMGIIHMGACSSTDECNGEYLIKNNTRYTNRLIDFCIQNSLRLIYASSASVYGLKGESFNDSNANLSPMNMYAFSKLITDNYLKFNYPNQKLITALRFFNVFGLNETHKIGMSSPIHTFNHQAKFDSEIKLFKEDNPKHLFQRDFIFVDDISELISIILSRKDCYGLFDVGSGASTSFRRVATIIKDWWLRNHGKVIDIKEIDFPEKLLGSYQVYTSAKMYDLFDKKLDWTPKETLEGIEIFLNKINVVR